MSKRWDFRVELNTEKREFSVFLGAWWILVMAALIVLVVVL